MQDAASHLVQEHTTIHSQPLQSLLDEIHTNLQRLYSLATEWGEAGRK